MSEKSKEIKVKQGYTKEQFLKSKRYKGVQKDVLNVILKDDERYTHKQVEKLISDFGKRKVK